MFELAQRCSALPLPASRKRTHLTSHTQHRAQSAEARPQLSLMALKQTFCHPGTPCSKSPHTQVKCGWEGGCNRFSYPALLRALLLGCSPAAAESCGSPTRCCLAQGNGGSLQDLGRRNSFGEGLTHQQSSVTRQALWWGGPPGAEQPHGQHKARTSANLPLCQL